MLIQGTNAPITIEFDDDTSNILDMSVALVKDDKTLTHWSKEEINLEGVFAYCPLTQDKTMVLPTGYVTLEVKWTNKDGEVNFADLVTLKVEKRVDSTILLEV